MVTALRSDSPSSDIVARLLTTSAQNFNRLEQRLVLRATNVSFVRRRLIRVWPVAINRLVGVSARTVSSWSMESASVGLVFVGWSVEIMPSFKPQTIVHIEHHKKLSLIVQVN